MGCSSSFSANLTVRGFASSLMSASAGFSASRIFFHSSAAETQGRNLNPFWLITNVHKISVHQYLNAHQFVHSLSYPRPSANILSTNPHPLCFRVLVSNNHTSSDPTNNNCSLPTPPPSCFLAQKEKNAPKDIFHFFRLSPFWGFFCTQIFAFDGKLGT